MAKLSLFSCFEPRFVPFELLGSAGGDPGPPVAPHLPGNSKKKVPRFFSHLFGFSADFLLQNLEVAPLPTLETAGGGGAPEIKSTGERVGIGPIHRFLAPKNT